MASSCYCNYTIYCICHLWSSTIWILNPIFHNVGGEKRNHLITLISKAESLLETAYKILYMCFINKCSILYYHFHRYVYMLYLMAHLLNLCFCSYNIYHNECFVLCLVGFDGGKARSGHRVPNTGCGQSQDQPTLRGRHYPNNWKNQLFPCSFIRM